MGSPKIRQPPSPCLAPGVFVLTTATALAFLLLARAGAGMTDGPTGRPVVGRIIAPADCGVKIDWAYGSNGIQAYQPAIKPPEGLSAPEKFKWYQEWSQSEAGKAYLRGWRTYAVKIGPDGSFRVDDVPAGSYLLSIRVTEPPDPTQSSLAGELLGSVTHTFIVPERPAGRGAEPLDLGKLELKVVKRLRVGAPAPAFQVESLDGKGLVKLEDHRGKYVLLNFWATWCGPGLRQTPYLKQVAEAYGKDPRFVIIGLSWDHSREEARQYIVKNGLGWAHGFLGDTQAHSVGGKIVEDYQVGLPSIWLIGPDGKVVARDLREEAIKEFVSKALDKPG